jgi:hypothetical protein
MAQVSGRFVDQEGIPVASGSLVIAGSGGAKSYSPLAEGGRFHVELLPEKKYRLVLSATSTLTKEIEIANLKPGETLDFRDVRAAAGFEVTGVVIDEITGERIANADIWTLKAKDRGGLLAYRFGDLLRTTTNAEGRFRLQGVDAQNGQVRIEASGYARVQLPYSASHDEPLHDLGEVLIDHGGELEIRLEQPIDGLVEIDLGRTGLPIDMKSWPVTAESALIPNLPEGEWQVRVTDNTGDEPSLICEEDVEVTPGERAVLDCEKRDMVVYGSAYIAEHPCGSGMLHWKIAGRMAIGGIAYVPDGLGGERRQSWSTGSPSVAVQTLEDGTFQTRSLRPGDWEVTFFGDDNRYLGPTEVSVADATEQTVRVQFGSHRVRGMVVDEEDAPVADCMVSEVDTGEATSTAPNGTFDLVLQPNPHARVRALDRNRTSQVESISFEESTVIDGIILELSSRGETVVVRVIDQDGNPAQGAYVIHQTDTGDSLTHPMA